MRKTLEFAPDNGGGWANLGLFYLDLGPIYVAMSSHDREVKAVKPGEEVSAATRSSMLVAKLPDNVIASGRKRRMRGSGLFSSNRMNMALRDG